MLPLIYHPLTIVRRGMAQLLTHLIFVPAQPAAAATATRTSLPDLPDGQTLLLPACFLQHFRFPCQVKPVLMQEANHAEGSKQNTLVRLQNLLSMLQQS